jgi:hypothetical protein
LVKSTKKKELHEAIQESYMLLANAKVRKEQNFTVATKRFKDVAKLTLKAMEEKQEAGDGRVSYEQYKRIINDFLIPFFGKRDVDSINAKALQEYAVYREQQMGRLPYALGYTIGKWFDLVTAITGKRFPISSIRVKKFCANSVYNTAIDETGFVPPVPLAQALEQTIRHEFIEKHDDEPLYFSE